MNDHIIVKFDVESMRESLHVAIMEREAFIGDMITSAVNEACTVENLKRAIDDKAREILNRAVNDAMEGYFKYGDGSRYIKASVISELEKIFPNDDGI